MIKFKLVFFTFVIRCLCFVSNSANTKNIKLQIHLAELYLSNYIQYVNANI